MKKHKVCNSCKGNGCCPYQNSDMVEECDDYYEWEDKEKTEIEESKNE